VGFRYLIRPAFRAPEDVVMFIMLSKKPRKTNRTKTKRFRAKLKAKNKARRGRVYQLGK
jgi:hypothetical protein